MQMHKHLESKVREIDLQFNSKVQLIYKNAIQNYNTSVLPVQQVFQPQEHLSVQKSLPKASTFKRLPKIKETLHKKEILLQVQSSKQPKKFKINHSQSQTGIKGSLTLEQTQVKGTATKLFDMSSGIQEVKQSYKKEVMDSIIKEQTLPIDKLFEETSPKHYQRLLDDHSLHQFIIRKGKTISDTPEFLSFRRTYNDIFQFIQPLIKRLEVLIQEVGIPTATINGKLLAQIYIKQRPKTDSYLLEALLQLNKYAHRFRYRGIRLRNSKFLAAVRIQSFFRMFRTRKHYLQLQQLIFRIKYIQRSYRKYLDFKRGKEARRQRAQFIIQQVQRLQQSFIQNYSIQRERFQVHIIGFTGNQIIRLTTQKFLQKMNCQMTRIFRAKDPLCHVILVAPLAIQPQIYQYYYKMLEMGGLHQPKSRITIVWTQALPVLNAHISPTQSLLYSRKTILRIKSIVGNKFGFIVPAYPSPEDYKLAYQLNLPLMSGHYQNHLYYSLKSGAKRLFKSLQIPTLQSILDIYSESELYDSLAIVIINNPQVQRWVLKIDDEIGGRGLAYLQVNKLKSVKKLLNSGQPRQDLTEKLSALLRQKLPSKLKIINTLLFKNCREFLMAFLSRGGIIEASPPCLDSLISRSSASFFIDPSGQFKFLNTYDKININEMKPVGCLGPSKRIQSETVLEYLLKLHKKFLAIGLIGFFTIDFLVLPDSECTAYAIGLDCFLNNYSSVSFMAQFMTNTSFEPADCLYRKVKTQESSISISVDKTFGKNSSHSFVYCPVVQNQLFTNIQFRTFFQICLLGNVSFDVKRKVGIVFTLLDTLQSGVISLVAFSNNGASGSLRYLNNCFDFLTAKVGMPEISKMLSDESRTDKISFSELTHIFKTVLRRMQKQLQQKTR